MNYAHQIVRPLLTGLLLAASAAAPLSAQLLPRGLERPAPERRVPGQGGQETQGRAVQELSGTWQGTVREVVPGSGEIRYPVTLQFSGRPEQLRLQVDGQAKVPVEGGQQLTAIVRALYQGQFVNGRLSMRSTSVETRIVEYGQTMPGDPQTLEATLQNGVLSGRAGSQGEWSHFEARPAGQRDPRGPGGQGRQLQPVGFAGTWSGVGVEPGPNGQQVRFPVQLQIAEQRGQVTAELVSDLQYPTGDGRSIPVRYTASFAGSAQRGELQLTSRQVSYFIVPQNRTQQGPQQTLTGRIENGVLRLMLGANGMQNSQIELRRQGGVPGGEQRPVNGPAGGPGGQEWPVEEVGEDDLDEELEGLEEIDENDPRWRELPPVPPVRGEGSGGSGGQGQGQGHGGFGEPRRERLGEPIGGRIGGRIGGGQRRRW